MNICGKKNELKEFLGISFCRQICIKLVQGILYFTKHLLMSKENLSVDFPGGQCLSPPRTVGDAGLSPCSGSSHVLQSNYRACTPQPRLTTREACAPPLRPDTAQ